MKTKYLLSLTLMVFAAMCVTATTVIPPTFEQLVGQAEVIFQGTVTNVKSTWEGEGAQRHIATYVTFEVGESVKGDAASSYTIRMLGGTVGDETMLITDTPNFKVGDREILFVEHNFDQFVPLVGIDHGHFRVQRDEQAGRDILVNGHGEPVKDVAKLGREEESVSAEEAISPAELKSAIRNELKAQADRSSQ